MTAIVYQIFWIVWEVTGSVPMCSIPAGEYEQLVSKLLEALHAQLN